MWWTVIRHLQTDDLVSNLSNRNTRTTSTTVKTCGEVTLSWGRGLTGNPPRRTGTYWRGLVRVLYSTLRFVDNLLSGVIFCLTTNDPTSLKDDIVLMNVEAWVHFIEHWGSLSWSNDNETLTRFLFSIFLVNEKRLIIKSMTTLKLKVFQLGL